MNELKKNSRSDRVNVIYSFDVIGLVFILDEVYIDIKCSWYYMIIVTDIKCTMILLKLKHVTNDSTTKTSPKPHMRTP